MSAPTTGDSQTPLTPASKDSEPPGLPGHLHTHVCIHAQSHSKSLSKEIYRNGNIKVYTFIIYQKDVSVFQIPCSLHILFK